MVRRNEDGFLCDLGMPARAHVCNALQALIHAARIGLSRHAWLERDPTELPSMMTGYFPSAARRGPQPAILPFRPSRVPSNPCNSTCVSERRVKGPGPVP